MTRPLLEVDSIDVAYSVPGGTRLVVDELSFSLAQGEIGCLLGESGCGKTTVLRAIAGFESVRAGRILLDGVLLASATTSLPPEQRRVGMMFQDYALFPHLDVSGNVAFGLRGMERARRRRRVEEMLELVGLATRGNDYPHELSGGQQQRVALARALAPAPEVLLLDEPLSNLDVHTRERLAGDLRALLRDAGVTALLVTHDQAEAFAMADHVGVMHDGRIAQWGSPANLYRRPAHRYVANFLGRGVLVPSGVLGLAPGSDVLIRPEDLRRDSDGPIRCLVESCVFRGPGLACRVRLSTGEALELDLPNDLAPPVPGDELGLRVAEDELPRFSD